MLATPGLSWLWVLAGVCLVGAAPHLRVVAAQLVVEALRLIVEVFVGDVTQSQRFALFFEFLIGQRAEAPQMRVQYRQKCPCIDAVTLGATDA